MFSNSQKRGLIWIFVAIAMAGLAFHLYDRIAPPPSGVSLNIKNKGTKVGSEANSSSMEIYVQLSGAVNNPGVYRVREGCRLFELIKLSGGLAPDADGNAVNLARVVKDGEKIYIPRIGEGKENRTGFSHNAGLSSKDRSGLINVNTASKEELEKLPGIGKVIAERIIKYRKEHGFFSAPSDLLGVKGIGKKKLERIRSMITF